MEEHSFKQQFSDSCFLQGTIASGREESYEGGLLQLGSPGEQEIKKAEYNKCCYRVCLIYAQTEAQDGKRAKVKSKETAEES